jgi:SAM-dependent methyltransferase
VIARSEPVPVQSAHPELQLDWDETALYDNWPKRLDHDFLLGRLDEVTVNAVLERGGRRVLDVAAAGAAHTCVMTLRGARAVALDPSVAMLRMARQNMVDRGAHIALVRGIGETLPFRDGAFDLIASALSLQLVNDLPGALIQIRRALRPDGLFLGAVLGGATLQELREAFLQAELELEGGISPRVAPMADIREFGGLLQRAGFALPVVDSDLLTVTYVSPLALMRDLRAMGAGNALSERRKTPLRRATLLRAAELYAERYPAAGGRVRASFEIIHLSGWSPHEGQQKPLRPGSAKSRLADALGVKEHRLKGT